MQHPTYAALVTWIARYDRATGFDSLDAHVVASLPSVRMTASVCGVRVDQVIGDVITYRSRRFRVQGDTVQYAAVPKERYVDVGMIGWDGVATVDEAVLPAAARAECRIWFEEQGITMRPVERFRIDGNQVLFALSHAGVLLTFVLAGTIAEDGVADLPAAPAPGDESLVPVEVLEECRQWLGEQGISVR